MFSHTRIVRTFASLYHKEGKVMKGKWFFGLICAFGLGLGGSLVWAHDPPPFPHNATFSTLITTPRAIEGLTGDHAGNLYTAGAAITSLGDTFCPVWRINLSSPTLVLVGKLPTPCSPLGMAFNDTGDLFVADGANATVWSFTPNAGTPPTATAFATGFQERTGLLSIGMATFGFLMGVLGKGACGRLALLVVCAIRPFRGVRRFCASSRCVTEQL